LTLPVAEADTRAEGECLVSVETHSEAAADSSSSSDARAVVRLLGDRPIVMIGMMGAGKTSVGKRLAARLGLPFVDADGEIEAAANATIPEIFERYGEPYFREGERRVIRRLLNGEAKVLSTGGGAYINEETRAAIGERGIAVWLKADLDVLMARVKRRSNRPLLKAADPEEVMRRLLEERSPIYAEAPIHVASREVAHDLVVDEIIAALLQHLRSEASPDGP
jgi:shikimate kinase